MAVNKHEVAVLDGPNQAGVFTDRVMAGQQLGIAASGTNPAIVVTFTEPLPPSYTVLVSQSAGGLPWFVNNKTTFGFTVNLVGTASGTIDVTVLAL